MLPLSVADTLGVEEALPLFVVEPPVAEAPPVCVKLTDNVFVDMPPTTAASELLPLMSASPPAATFPFPPPPFPQTWRVFRGGDEFGTAEIEIALTWSLLWHPQAVAQLRLEEIRLKPICRCWRQPA